LGGGPGDSSNQANKGFHGRTTHHPGASFHRPCEIAIRVTLGRATPVRKDPTKRAPKNRPECPIPALGIAPRIHHIARLPRRSGRSLAIQRFSDGTTLVANRAGGDDTGVFRIAKP
jgi:hypothetical protein